METYEAETSFLGSVLIEGSLFKDVEIDENYFAYKQHQLIFQAMTIADKKKRAIDVVIVTTTLSEKGNLQAAGGVSYLTKIAESVPSTTTFKHYEQLLKEAYQLLEAKRAVERFLYKPSKQTIDQLLEDLKECQELTLNRKEKTTYDHLVEISEELIDPSQEDVGYEINLPSFDGLTGGLQRGDLNILAARPSVGKTAFALNLANGHCKNGGSTLIFSLEMGTKQLLKRMISAEGMVDISKWRDIMNLFTATDYEYAVRAIGELTDWNIEIDDTKRTITEIRAAIRKYIHDHPGEKPLVIIDYLQLISPSLIRKDRRDLEIGEITRELKLLALDLNIPIVLLSQLSRGVDARQDKRPMMSDLRESGNIEQDADVIAFLYREDYYNRQTNQENELEVIIAKHRNGPTGSVKLEFLREYGRVEEKRALARIK